MRRIKVHFAITDGWDCTYRGSNKYLPFKEADVVEVEEDFGKVLSSYVKILPAKKIGVNYRFLKHHSWFFTFSLAN